MRVLQHPRSESLLFSLFLGVLIIAGCDSSGDSDPLPSATFEATITAADEGVTSFSGDAQTTDLSAMGGAFTGGVVPLPSPDSAFGPRPFPTEPPEGTAILLSSQASSLSGIEDGRVLSFLLPGDDIAEDTYEIAAIGVGPIGIGRIPLSTDAQGVPTTATYTEIDGSTFRSAFPTSGSITVTRVTADGIFGEFTLETEQAVSLEIPSDPTNPTAFPDTSSFAPEPFIATINGTFEARRIEEPDISQ